MLGDGASYATEFGGQSVSGFSEDSDIGGAPENFPLTLPPNGAPETDFNEFLSSCATDTALPIPASYSTKSADGRRRRTRLETPLHSVASAQHAPGPSSTEVAYDSDDSVRLTHGGDDFIDKMIDALRLELESVLVGRAEFAVLARQSNRDWKHFLCNRHNCIQPPVAADAPLRPIVSSSGSFNADDVLSQFYGPSVSISLDKFVMAEKDRASGFRFANVTPMMLKLSAAIFPPTHFPTSFRVVHSSVFVSARILCDVLRIYYKYTFV